MPGPCATTTLITVPEFIKRPTLLSAWVAVAVWVMAYGLLKAFSLDGLDIDSAEQVYFAQSWQLGYGTRQPPLYTWLMLWLKPPSLSWGAMLEIARYFCLVLWLAGVQALARACGADRSVQARVVLAHLGLLLAMWRVHDSLTHTVLAAAVTLWGSVAVIQALARPRWWPLVGLLAALACLSKLNAALWCVSSLLAAWGMILRTSKDQVQADRATPGMHFLWMLMALLVFVAVIAPYAHWWLTQPSGSVALARRIVISDEHAPMWQPLAYVLMGSLEYLLLTPLLLAAIVWRVRAGHAVRVPKSRTPAGQWLVWQTGIGLLILLVTLMAMKATHFTPRWLWPVIPGATVCMCVGAFQALDSIEALSVWRTRMALFTWAMAMLALSVVGLRIWVPQVNAQRCVNCWTDRPAAVMSEDLHQRYGHQPLRVITGDDHLAGILAQVDARDSTWTSGSVDLPPPDDFELSRAPCIAAWVAMDKPQPMPTGLRHLVGPATSEEEVNQGHWPMRLAPQRSIWLLSMALPQTVCDKARQ